MGEDAVAVSLVPSRPTSAAAAGAAMDVDAGAEVAPDSSAEDDDSSSSSSSSSSSDDDDDEAAAAAAASDGEGEPLDIIKDYAGIKKLIADMDADDADGGGGGGDGEPAAALRAEAQLLGGAPLPSLAALEIAADDAVQAAGVVQSMLEGMVVIRVSAGSSIELLAFGGGCVCSAPPWGAGSAPAPLCRQAASCGAASGGSPLQPCSPEAPHPCVPRLGCRRRRAAAAR